MILVIIKKNYIIYKSSNILYNTFYNQILENQAFI